jgi:hypothetical protein
MLNEKDVADRMTEIIFKISTLEGEKAKINKRYNGEIATLNAELNQLAFEYKNPQPDLFQASEGKTLFEEYRAGEGYKITTTVTEKEGKTKLAVRIEHSDEEDKFFFEEFDNGCEALERLIRLDRIMLGLAVASDSESEDELFDALDTVLPSPYSFIDGNEILQNTYYHCLIREGYDPKSLTGDLNEHLEKKTARLEQIENETDPNVITDPMITLDLKRWIAAIEYYLKYPETETDQNTEPNLSIPDAQGVEDIQFN